MPLSSPMTNILISILKHTYIFILIQPSAMHVNFMVLGETFEALVRHAGEINGADELEVESAVDDLKRMGKEEFPSMFQDSFNRMRAKKLGLQEWSNGKELDMGEGEGEGNGALPRGGDDELWAELDMLMYRSGADMTIFFRELSHVHPDQTAAAAFGILGSAFYDSDLGISQAAMKAGGNPSEEEWQEWLKTYQKRLQQQKEYFKSEERTRVMRMNNPKFVLRNWMGVLAYEAAQEGDYSVIEELQVCLSLSLSLF